MTSNNQMLAAVYRGRNNVRVESIPVPVIGPGEALIQIEACGVCGTDLKKIDYGLVDPPRVFGHEMSGTIAALGEGVVGWQTGDRVSVMHHVPCLDCWYCGHSDFAQCPVYKQTGTTAGFEPAGGGFAQYIRVMEWVVRRGMVRIPDDVSWEDATFIEPLNTVLKGVIRADVSHGDSALVIGQGQIGLMFNQVLASRGLRVVGSDPLVWRCEQGIKFGASIAVDPSVAADAVRNASDGRGVDLVVVAVSNSAVMETAMRLVRPGGRVLLFAQTRLNDPVVVDAGEVCMLEKSLIGSYSSDISLQDEAAELIFSRTVNVHDLVTDRYPLKEIDRALAVAAAPRKGSLKVMVLP